MAANPTQGAGTLDAAAAAIQAKWDEADTADETTAEVGADEAEAVEAETEEAEAESVDAEIESEDSEEQSPIETLEQLAEALGKSVEDVLKGLRHKVKVQDEESDVNLAELVAGYQKNSDYRQKTNALKREREEFEAKRGEILKQIDAEHAQNAYILNTMEQQLMQAANSEEMQRLKQTNRPEWVAKMFEVQQQMQGLQQLKAQAAQRYQTLQSQAESEQRERLSKMLELEKASLAEKIPDWGDAKRVAVNEYAVKSLGFKPEEVANVLDHRFVVMAHKAMLYDQAQQNQEATVRKVKTAPKLLKPVAKATPASVTAKDVQKLRNRFKQTGRLEDMAALMVKTGKI